MERQALISKLETVHPAVAINKLVPILTHFWFTGHELVGHNDQIAISTRFPENGVIGAVPATLLDLLKIEHSAEVVLSASDDTFTAKIGKGSIKLKMLPGDFFFSMPDVKAEPDKNMMRQLVRGLEHCSLAIGTNTAKAEYLGVTMVKEENLIALYSTDEAAIARAYINNKNLEFGERAILPARFCEQLLRLYNNATAEKRAKATFEIDERSVRIRNTEMRDKYALFQIGNNTLYGRLLLTREPIAFDRLLRQYMPEEYEGKLTTIPRELHHALERAGLICDPQRLFTELTVERKKVSLKSRSEKEEVRDEIKLDHPDVEQIRIHSKPVRKATETFDEIAIGEKSIALVKWPRKVDDKGKAEPNKENPNRALLYVVANL